MTDVKQVRAAAYADPTDFIKAWSRLSSGEEVTPPNLVAPLSFDVINGDIEYLKDRLVPVVARSGGTFGVVTWSASRLARVSSEGILPEIETRLHEAIQKLFRRPVRLACIMEGGYHVGLIPGLSYNRRVPDVLFGYAEGEGIRIAQSLDIILSQLPKRCSVAKRIRIRICLNWNGVPMLDKVATFPLQDGLVEYIAWVAGAVQFAWKHRLQFRDYDMFGYLEDNLTDEGKRLFHIYENHVHTSRGTTRFSDTISPRVWTS